ncbi:hypothetical protein GCM10023192_14990 [Amycolatopsis samaneae]
MVEAADATGIGPIESRLPGAFPCGSFEHAGPKTSALVVTPSPEAALLGEALVGALLDGAGAEELVPPLPESVPHAVSVRSAAAAATVPVTRILFT